MRSVLSRTVYRRTLLLCEHLDVNKAFLYATLDIPVFLQGFPGYECAPEKCLKAVKAIYGLRNAPKASFDRIKQFLIDQGYCQSCLDPCLYFQHIDNSIVMILIYVDDIIILAKDRDTINRVVQMFKTGLRVKTLVYLNAF